MDDAGARGGVGQAHAPGDVDRFEAMEQQVRQLTSRLAGWVEAQLVQAVDDRRNDMKALRAELQAILDEQLAGLRAERTPSVDSERLDALEQRVRSAMSRLSDSVEARLTEVVRRRQSELDALRSQLQAIDHRVGEPASAAGLSALSTRLDQRLDEVETRLAEAATTRSADLEGLRSELTKRIDDLQRTGSTMRERVDAVAQRTSTVADDIGALRVEVKAGTARNDQLEKRVKAAIGRLADSVETRLNEFVEQSSEGNTTKRAEAAEQLRAAVDKVREQVTAALDAHLTETRDEVTLAVGKGRAELAASVAQLESLQVAFEEQAHKTEAGLDALNASVPATLREAEARLRETVQAKQGDFEAVAARVAKARTEMDATVASVNRKLARTEDQVQKRMATLTEKVDALTKTAAVEAGSLAPLRSDLRLVQAQLAELAQVVADLRPKRKAPAKKVAAPAAPAKKVAAAPAKKAPRRKAQ